MPPEEKVPTIDREEQPESGSPWLSVIIPVYNDGKLALRAVKAVLAGIEALPVPPPEESPRRGVEILCVEGGSSDDSAEMLEELCAGQSRLRLLRCPSGAVSPKFNLGAREAGGEWLAFTESDCIPAKGWIAAWRGVVDEGRWAACAGRVKAASDDPAAQVSIRDFSEKFEVRPGLWAKAVSYRHGQGNNFLIRKDVFLELGGADERLGAGAPARSGQDSELNFRLLEAGYSIGYEPEAAVVHAPVETSASFLLKKRNYYYADSWWRAALYPGRPGSLLGLMLRALYPPSAALFALLRLRPSRARLHMEEWKGFFAGLRDGLAARAPKS